MGSGWHTVPLGDLAEIFDGPHATPPKTDEGPVFLGISSLGGGRVILSDLDHLSESDYLRWTKRVEPCAGDVVFSYETRLGEAAAIPAGLRCCLGRRMGLLRPRPGAVDHRFLLYAYLGPEFQETLRERTIHGSTVDRIPLTALPDFPITVPQDIREQRAIAHILGTLDDRIELNRRMSETLEAMARALFKSWFVDFDPVRAKMEGRWRPGESLPGLPAHLCDLFPDRLVDSELGEIPEGWEVRPFTHTVEIVSGGTPKTSIPEYWGGDIPWFSVVDAPTDSNIWVVDTQRKITAEGLHNSSTQILPIGSTIISARGTVGRIALVGTPMAMNQSCYGLCAREGSGNYLTYLQTQQLVARLQRHAHGSVFDTITRKTLEEVLVAIPSAETGRAFGLLVGPWMERIRAAVGESHTLAALRDTLLPKLISGEIRVSEGMKSDLHAAGALEKNE